MQGHKFQSQDHIKLIIVVMFTPYEKDQPTVNYSQASYEVKMPQSYVFGRLLMALCTLGLISSPTELMINGIVFNINIHT